MICPVVLPKQGRSCLSEKGLVYSEEGWCYPLGQGQRQDLWEGQRRDLVDKETEKIKPSDVWLSYFIYLGLPSSTEELGKDLSFILLHMCDIK